MAGAAAAAAAAMMQAVKASGVVVRVEPAAFAELLARTPDPLVVHAIGGVFTTKYLYLTPYRGLAFHTTSLTPLELPPRAEVIHAKKLWVPE